MDNLIKPLSSVFLIWWLLFFAAAIAVGAATLGDVPRYGLRVAVVIVFGCAIGWIGALLLTHRLPLSDLRQRITQKSSDQTPWLNVSLGNLPGFYTLKQPGTSPSDLSWVPVDMRTWWKWYCATHPAFAKAFHETWGVMEATPVPASPYKGGHDGATLVEHSWNVLRTLLQEKEHPPYVGMINKDGKVVFDLQNDRREPYRFEYKDPLPMLCAFAHDIGKVACYKVHAGGAIEQVKPDHDTEGARILNGLPAWRALPFSEYQRALVCVGWYHKPGELPRAEWIDDRARALLMLIGRIDALTGKMEGEGRYSKFIRNSTFKAGAPIAAPAMVAAPVAAKTAPSVNEEDEQDDVPAVVEQPRSKTAPAQVECPVDRTGDGRDESFERSSVGNAGGQPHEDAPPADGGTKKLFPPLPESRPDPVAPAPTGPSFTADAPAGPAIMPAPDISPVLAHLEDDEIIDLVTTLLLKQGSLGGVQSTKRVGLKYGSWLYLHDAALNDRMRETYSGRINSPFEDNHFTRPGSGQSSDFSKRLLIALANRGALKQEHKGKYYGKHTAFAYLGKESLVDSGAPPAPGSDVPGQYTIVCRAFAFGQVIFDLKDVPREPYIARMVHENKALKKPENIETVKARLAQWREPKDNTLQRKQDATQARSEKREVELKNLGINRTPFDRSMLAFMGKEELKQAQTTDDEGRPCYRVDVVMQKFSAPVSGVETIDINGVAYWRFVGARK